MANLLHVAAPVQPDLPAAVAGFAVGIAARVRHRAPRGGCTVGGKFYRGGSFCPPFDADNPRGLAVVEIRGASYLVEPIPAGECGVSAVRLTKRAGGASYDLIRRHDGLVECDCPSYTFAHEGKGTTCKHGVACMAHGLLPVAPAPAAELPPEVPGDDESPARAWDAWTDADRWELGPEEVPSPSWDAPTFEPEDVAAAYQLGYELGLAGEYPKPPAHLSDREKYHFNCGRLAGFIASPDGRAWYRDMDALEDRPAADRVHDCERTGVC